MQPFVVNLCWWILSSVLFFSLRPPLWSSLRRPPLCLRPGHHPRGLCQSSAQPRSSSVRVRGGDGALSDTGVPRVTAVVAADGPGQAWVMLWGSQIISTWSRNEPELQLDSYGLDSWQKSLSSSRCIAAPPSGRGLSCSLYLWPIKSSITDVIKDRGYRGWLHCSWNRRLDFFPWRDVITVRLSKHEPVIQCYPVSRDFNSLTAKRGIRSINFVQGTTPQRGNWKGGGGRGMIFLALTVLLHS